MNIIIFGAPGVGKGTQSALLVEKLDMRHISTGDLFRAAMKNETPLGLKAQSYIDNGDLVPDEITIGLVDEVLQNLNDQDFILDGFPRTTPQAEALDKLLDKHHFAVDKVISLTVPKEQLVERLTGRRLCQGCGAVYHVAAKPSKEDGICDVCGNELIQRKDDQPNVVQNRLGVYEDNTRPVMDYYSNTDRMVEVDGKGSTEEVFERLQKHLK